MNRRHFFQAAGITSASLALPVSAMGAGMNTLLHQQVKSNQKILFQDNLQITPLRGYHGQNISCDYAQIEGQIPKELRGVFYRNGPGLFERGGKRYQHWFDGDGMVHAWRFTDQGVSHQARFVATKKFIAESKANEFLVPAFGTYIEPKMPVRSADSVNVANTSVVQLNGQLLALWEGGSAHALDAETLATKGIVSWSSELAGMPFSAHPKVELDGSMWNFGAQMGKMVLYQISKEGKLLKHLVFNAPAGAMVHDFAVSQRHLIFLMPPIHLDFEDVRNGKSMAESMQWKGNNSTTVLIVDKNDFTKRRILELPAMMVFHFGNAWEENNVIHLDFVRSKDLSIMNEWMPKMMRGENVQADESHPALLSINLNNGQMKIENRNESVEFPRIDPRFVGQKNTSIFYPCSLNKKDYNQFTGVMRLDVQSGNIDQFHFSREVSLEEHVVVPKPNSSKEGDAWLVGVGFDIARQTSFASIFDTQKLSNGPLALVHLPYWVPTCFHGNFYSS